MLCIWWDWKRVLCYEFLPEKTNNLFQHRSQLDQLKAALYYKRPELVNKKCIIFHQDPSGSRKTICFLDDHAKTVAVWLGHSDSFIIFTRHCTFRCPVIFDLYKILYMENISIPWKTIKGTWIDSAGDYQADEQAGVAGLSWRLFKQLRRHESCRQAGDYQADEQALILRPS